MPSFRVTVILEVRIKLSQLILCSFSGPQEVAPEIQADFSIDHTPDIEARKRNPVYE